MTTYPNRPFADRFLRLSTVDTVAGVLGRYGLVIVIGWIGALKFANFEAHQIQPLVANSPFMGWLYDFLPVYTFSALLGVVELTAAILLAIKPRGSQTVDRRKSAFHRLVRVDDKLSLHDPWGERAGRRRVSRAVIDWRVPAQRHSATGSFVLDLGGRHEGSRPTRSGTRGLASSKRTRPRRRWAPRSGSSWGAGGLAIRSDSCCRDGLPAGAATPH